MAGLKTVYDELSPGFDIPLVMGPDTLASPYDLEDVARIVAAIAASKEISVFQNLVRVYISDRRLTTFDVQTLMKRIAEADAVRTGDWEALFGADEFMIFVNFAGRFDEAVCRKTSALTKDLMAMFNDGCLFLEHHILIGKYRQTPFGVHIDSPHDRVIHFNLGPNTKSMLLWSIDDYVAHAGQHAPLTYDGWKGPPAQEFEIGAGEGFVLPFAYYHVGRSMPEPSVSVLLAFSRSDASTYWAAAMDELGKAVGPRLPDKDPRPYAAKDDDAVLKAIEAAIPTPDMASRALRRHILRLKSSDFIVDWPSSPEPRYIAPGRYRLGDAGAVLRGPGNADEDLVFCKGVDMPIFDNATREMIDAVAVGDVVALTDEDLANLDQERIAVLVWLVGLGGVAPA